MFFFKLQNSLNGQNAFRCIHEFLLKEITPFISPSMHVGCIEFLQFPPSTQKHANEWIGYAELSLVVNECVDCSLH